MRSVTNAAAVSLATIEAREGGVGFAPAYVDMPADELVRAFVAEQRRLHGWADPDASGDTSARALRRVALIRATARHRAIRLPDPPPTTAPPPRKYARKGRAA